jgi:hypothetical protein
MNAGTPRTLRPLRWGAGLVRGRFELHRNGHHYVVDAGYLDLDERIHLYRDGLHVGSARRKANFVIDDDVRIEAAVSKLGMKYVRARSRGTREPQPLAPAQGTAEAWRARVDREHPAASRAVGLVATLVLVAVLALEVPQLINLIGLFAPHIGLPTFAVPMVALNGWQNLLVIVVGGLAAIERGLSMKYNPLLDD